MSRWSAVQSPVFLSSRDYRTATGRFYVHLCGDQRNRDQHRETILRILVWITPFPTVDMILEAANKAMCAALMALYMYSPTLATVVNLLLLIACLFVVGWCYRRLHFYRELACGPILAWLLPNWFAQKGNRFRVFSSDSIASLPAYTAMI